MIDLPKPMIPDFKGGPVVFLKEVRSELAKVIWPTKNEVIKLTLIVVVISVVIGLYIGGLDFVFTKLTDILVRR
jgi:preprotein translocase subunit SecE